MKGLMFRIAIQRYSRSCALHRLPIVAMKLQLYRRADHFKRPDRSEERCYTMVLNNKKKKLRHYLVNFTRLDDEKRSVKRKRATFRSCFSSFAYYYYYLGRMLLLLYTTVLEDQRDHPPMLSLLWRLNSSLSKPTTVATRR